MEPEFIIWPAIQTIVAWITGIRLQRRISRVLRRDVTEMELTSFNMWMQVDEEEEKSRVDKIS